VDDPKPSGSEYREGEQAASAFTTLVKKAVFGFFCVTRQETGRGGKMSDIYGGRDSRDVPAYGMTEAAKYLKIPPATLRAWIVGRHVSFYNLIEVHVLRALRTPQGISLFAVREAIRTAQEKFHIERLLLNEGLRAAAGELFLEQYGQLTQLKRSGQRVLAEHFRAHVARIDWDKDLPIRLYPFLTGSIQDSRKGIVIDARRAFGRPIIADRGISISAIIDRIDAGEEEAVITEDYGLTHDQIVEALDYEQAA
jgi:uncharacterized protein (DUF433 family)